MYGICGIHTNLLSFIGEREGGHGDTMHFEVHLKVCKFTQNACIKKELQLLGTKSPEPLLRLVPGPHYVPQIP